MGDRGYSNANGVDYVRRHDGQVLMRANPMSLPSGVDQSAGQ
jgi:hypothetical protein